MLFKGLMVVQQCMFNYSSCVCSQSTCNLHQNWSQKSNKAVCPVVDVMCHSRNQSWGHFFLIAMLVSSVSSLTFVISTHSLHSLPPFLLFSDKESIYYSKCYVKGFGRNTPQLDSGLLHKQTPYESDRWSQLFFSSAQHRSHPGLCAQPPSVFSVYP